jgi:hypothetical protein
MPASPPSVTSLRLGTGLGAELACSRSFTRWTAIEESFAPQKVQNWPVVGWMLPQVTQTMFVVMPLRAGVADWSA